MPGIISSVEWRGLPALSLENDAASITVVPESGARIVSLRSRRTGREWIDGRGDNRPVARAAPGTAFHEGPRAGADECLPTIGACRVGDAELPDHGEVWTSAWQVDPDALARGELTTTVGLTCLPLRFARTVSSTQRGMRLAYRLDNTSAAGVPFLWAWHPLLTREPGDGVEFAGARTCLVTATKGFAAPGEGRWPIAEGRLSLADWLAAADAPTYCKAFVPSAPDGAVVLRNHASGARLRLVVDPAELPYWGYWCSRGAWHGGSQAAIEPTHAPRDRLDDVAPSPVTTIGARAVRTWTVDLELD